MYRIMGRLLESSRSMFFIGIKLIWNDNAPTDFQNTGAKMNFDGSATPLNGSEFTLYDVTSQYYNYIANKSQQAAISQIQADASQVAPNYAKNITLDTLAEITHTNKYYFAHSFTECIGESPIHYLMNRRIQVGKDLLVNTNHSILQIAESTGFSSQSYFSQAFKKETGMTPQQFRKQNTP